MTVASDRITELLHLSRSAGWTADDALALAAAVRAASSDEAKLALIGFSYSLLAAARSVATLQLDAARGEHMIDERDEHGGTLQ